MKKVKILFIQNPVKGLFSLLVLLSMVFWTSCNQKEDAVAIHEANLSGQDLYKSIFFAHGDYAGNIKSYQSNIDAISKLSVERREIFEKNIDQLIDGIGEKSPEFYDDFKMAILSKEHRQIEKAITDGSVLLYEQIREKYPNIEKVHEKMEEDYASGKILTDGELDEEKLEDQLEEYQELLQHNMVTNEENEEEEVNAACSFGIACVFLAAVAIHNTVVITAAGAVIVVLAVATGVKFNPSHNRVTNGSPENSLAFEMLVNEIATIR